MNDWGCDKGHGRFDQGCPWCEIERWKFNEEVQMQRAIKAEAEVARKTAALRRINNCEAAHEYDAKAMREIARAAQMIDDTHTVDARLLYETEIERLREALRDVVSEYLERSERLEAEVASRSDLVDRLGDECERLLAEVAKYKVAQREITCLLYQPPTITPGADPRSWGAGFATAHQMVLNIFNRAALEDK